MQTRLLTVVFTDIVGSTDLKRRLGDRAAFDTIAAHHAIVQEVLRGYAAGREIETAGDSFLLAFDTVSDAVSFVLTLRAALREWNVHRDVAVRDRFGLHVGEIVVSEAGGRTALSSMTLDACARITTLADADRILCSRVVFDNARQYVRAVDGIGTLAWFDHGPYFLKGIDEPLSVCEIAEEADGTREPPSDTDKAHRAHSVVTFEPGWRPAVGQMVLNTDDELVERLGEGAVGETWLVRSHRLGALRVAKFCLHPDRLRAMKREKALFQLLRDRVGWHPHLLGVLDISLDTRPAYLLLPYAEGGDLHRWWSRRGGIVALEERIALVAQVADALAAAHAAGVVHRDVKPQNILLERLDGPPHVRLSDFGIGQVVAGEVPTEGFTKTLLGTPSTASGGVSGTLAYLAPELLTGQPATPQSDIYSVGIVLYQVWRGDLRRPLPSDWQSEIDDPVLRDDIALCVAGDPERRFRSASLLRERLLALPGRRREHAEALARTRRRERRAFATGVLAAGLVGLLVVGVMIWLAVAARNRERDAVAARESAEVERSARRLQTERLAVDAAAALLSSGDPLSALPHLVEAIEAVEGDPVRERLARIRFAHTLHNAPRLIYAREGGEGTFVLAPDGERAALSAPDGLWIIDLDTFVERRVTSDPGPWIMGWHPERPWLGGWRNIGRESSDGAVRVFDTEDGNVLAALDHAPPLTSGYVAAYWLDDRYVAEMRDAYGEWCAFVADAVRTVGEVLPCTARPMRYSSQASPPAIVTPTGSPLAVGSYTVVSPASSPGTTGVRWLPGALRASKALDGTVVTSQYATRRIEFRRLVDGAPARPPIPGVCAFSHSTGLRRFAARCYPLRSVDNMGDYTRSAALLWEMGDIWEDPARHTGGVVLDIAPRSERPEDRSHGGPEALAIVGDLYSTRVVDIASGDLLPASSEKPHLVFATPRGDRILDWDIIRSGEWVLADTRSGEILAREHDPDYGVHPFAWRGEDSPVRWPHVAELTLPISSGFLRLDPKTGREVGVRFAIVQPESWDWRPDGSVFGAANAAGISLFRPARGSPEATFAETLGPYIGLRWSRDGRKLLAANVKRDVVEVWSVDDTADGLSVAAKPGHVLPVTQYRTMTMSSDARRVLVVDELGVWLFDLQTLLPRDPLFLRHLPSNVSNLHAGFSPDDRLVHLRYISVDREAMSSGILTWDVATGALLGLDAGSWHPFPQRRSDGAWVVHGTFEPDERPLAELSAHAEMLSAHEVGTGRWLDPHEILERWNALRDPSSHATDRRRSGPR